ncbi:MAG TPA: ATP-binding protein [Candidatus Eremiobacteraceae bacterium]|nr:ATP-binding protein [Candidatus Eremiobacteraceae bacterium]
MREHLMPGGVEHSLDGNLQLRIPSRAEWVSVARLAVAGIAHRIDATIDEVEDLKLAVAEACTNCIQHAQGNEEVLVSFEISGRRITVVVEDGGKGFDGRALAPEPLGEPKVGGLGVFLIRSLMDEVDYDFDPLTGTKLTMSKMLGQ